MERYGRCRVKEEKRERERVEEGENRDAGERVGYCMYTQKAKQG